MAKACGQQAGQGTGVWERAIPAEATALPQLLNCIMDMAEKTRRSLTVLRRCQEADREELNHWVRRYSDAEDTKKGPSTTTTRPLSSSTGAEGSQLGVLGVGGRREWCRESAGALQGA